jgi:hypothetical protein
VHTWQELHHAKVAVAAFHDDETARRLQRFAEVKG